MNNRKWIFTYSESMVEIYESGVFDSATKTRIGIMEIGPNSGRVFTVINKETKEQVIVLFGTRDMLFFHPENGHLKKSTIDDWTMDILNKKYEWVADVTEDIKVIFWR
jgi:hypothetical protein